MPIYTVHEPRRNGGDRDDDTLAHTVRFQFVRDGFHFWAFLLAPLWMLRHLMWLEFIIYLLLVGGITFVLRRLALPGEIAFVVGALIALLIGIEAGTLRRFKLARRGWSNVGVIVGDDREMAEQRFFDAWVRATPAPWPLGTAPTPRTSASDVISLFPQPGAPQ